MPRSRRGPAYARRTTEEKKKPQPSCLDKHNTAVVTRQAGGKGLQYIKTIEQDGQDHSDTPMYLLGQNPAQLSCRFLPPRLPLSNLSLNPSPKEQQKGEGRRQQRREGSKQEEAAPR